MKKTLNILLTAFWLTIFPPSILAQKMDTLFVSLDMHVPLSEGWLDPATEKAGLRGDSHPLSWGTTYFAEDENHDSLYTINIPFSYDGKEIKVALKIKVDGTQNPDDGWQKGRNHIVTLSKASKDTLSLAWNEKAPPPPSTLTGNIQIIKGVESNHLLLPRDLFIYLPPGYEEGNQRYPVLYMHDGQNLFDAAAAGQEWRLDETAQSLIKSGEIAPLIIVGIGNTENRIDEYTPTREVWNRKLIRISPGNSAGKYKMFSGSFASDRGDTIHFRSGGDTLFTNISGGDIWQQTIKKQKNVFYQPQAGITFRFHRRDKMPVDTISASKPDRGGEGKRYSEFIVEELKPFIDSSFRTMPGRKHTSIGGSSLGGLISLYTGLKHPDLFGNLLIVSPSVWWDDKHILKVVQELSKETGQNIWLYIGLQEGQAAGHVKELHDLLLRKGWPPEAIKYAEGKGAGHNERAWAKQAEQMLRFNDKHFLKEKK